MGYFRASCLFPAMSALPAVPPPALPLGAEPMSPLLIFFGLRGRVPRRTWWLYGVLAPTGLGVLVTVLMRVVGFGPAQTEETVNLLVMWPMVAVSAKRWHDRNRSAWWVLVWLLPVVGWLWAVIDNGLLRGTRGPNRYGDDLTERF
jgi:uncharacterized membrane protein YhaH (DUF805 family)